MIHPPYNHLHPQVTAGSAFPQLVSPQRREAGSVLTSAARVYSKLSSLIAAQQTDKPLFALTYETRPFNSKADHR